MNYDYQQQEKENRLLMKVLAYLIVILLTLVIAGTLMSFEKAVKTTNVSWYGPGFHGRVTANGETYNQNDLTCASPFLPFNTKVEITNTKNSKSIIVRVNDRGPYKCYKDSITGKTRPYRPLEAHPTRGFDLSKAAFDSIGNVNSGILKVKYRILERGLKYRKCKNWK